VLWQFTVCVLWHVFTYIQDCDCTVSHRGLREKSCGSQKKTELLWTLERLRTKIFSNISDWVFRNLETWNNFEIQRLKGTAHDGDYMLATSWTSSLICARIHSAVFLKHSKYHMCWIRDVMFLLIQHSYKGKSVPLQVWSGPEGFRKLRFPDYMTTAQDGGKVVNLTHRLP